MTTVLRAVELARTLRGQAGLRLRQPLRRMWLALPARSLGGRTPATEQALLDLLGDEVNVKHIELIGDESELVERRVKPLLPVIGPRLGRQIPQVMAAARAGEVEYLSDGGVRLAGVTLAADEIEILATPRPGTAVAHDDGLVVVIDTELDDELRAEGNARELARLIQDLRKQAGLELDDLVEVRVDGAVALLDALEPHLDTVARDVLATSVERSAPSEGDAQAELELDGGRLAVGLGRASPRLGGH